MTEKRNGKFRDPKDLITHEELLRLVAYEPETGLFRNLTFRHGSRPSQNGYAGHRSKNGYNQVFLNYKHYMGHRLAWFYMTGAWPKYEVDHINLVKGDDRWANLREANPSEQGQNVGLRSSNTSGFTGVTKNRQGNWKAMIQVNKVQTYLGKFPTVELAAEAYAAAKRKLHTFSPNVIGNFKNDQ